MPNIPYSTGTWTPTVAGSAGTPTFDHQFGTWTRIGNILHFTATLTIHPDTATGTAQFSLPIDPEQTLHHALNEIMKFEVCIASGTATNMQLMFWHTSFGANAQCTSAAAVFNGTYQQIENLADGEVVHYSGTIHLNE